MLMETERFHQFRSPQRWPRFTTTRLCGVGGRLRRLLTGAARRADTFTAAKSNARPTTPPHYNLTTTQGAARPGRAVQEDAWRTNRPWEGQRRPVSKVASRSCLSSKAVTSRNTS